MKLKEVYVTREDPAKIFSIVEDVLVENPNTQIFMDNEIYSQLNKDGRDYHVFSKGFAKRFHYYHNRNLEGGEEWLSLCKDSAASSEIASGSFISNCKNYVQLVEFRSSKIDTYLHYLAGFDQLLIIHLEKESK